MANSPNSLTTEQRALVEAWIRTHWADRPGHCPICGTRTWEFSEFVIQPLTHVPLGSVQVGGIGYPMILVICQNCGYTMQFNAVKMGVFDVAEKQQAAKTEGTQVEGANNG